MNAFKVIAALSMMSVPALASANAAADATATAPAAMAASVKSGAMVFSADGRRIGKVDRVRTTDGVTSVSIIYENHFIYVPVSTLTASDHGFTSSLSKDQLKGM